MKASGDRQKGSLSVSFELQVVFCQKTLWQPNFHVLNSSKSVSVVWALSDQGQSHCGLHPPQLNTVQTVRSVTQLWYTLESLH